MRLQPFSLHRYRTIARQFLLCLMLLALGVRAAIPTGYMPDSEAMRNGQLAITLCTVDGKLTEYLLALDLAHDDTAPASIQEMSCVFGMIALQAVAPILHVTYLLPPATADPAQPKRAQHVHISGLLALGPPLGSRAPPSTLG